MRHEIRIELRPPTRREAELLMRRTGSIPDPTSPGGYDGVMICADCSERRVTAAAAGWTGPTCPMCHGTGVYPYRPPDGIRWGRCGACNGHGREPQ